MHAKELSIKHGKFRCITAMIIVQVQCSVHYSNQFRNFCPFDTDTITLFSHFVVVATLIPCWPILQSEEHLNTISVL